MGLVEQLRENRLLSLILFLVVANMLFSIYIFLEFQKEKGQASALFGKVFENVKSLNEKDSDLEKLVSAKSEQLTSYVNFKSNSLSRQIVSSESKLSALISEIEKQTSIDLGNLQKQLQGEIAGVSEQVSIVSPDFAAIASNSISSIVIVEAGNKLGSGAILTANGYIVTNYHVIDGASAITVDKSTGGTFNATISQSSQADDLAILKIESSSNLPFLQLGDSAKIKVGQKVIALGNPVGLTATVTEGIVSAVNRNIEGLGNGLIQTDVSINPGNSGGPLIDGNGKIIGINEAKVENTEGLGFAIPSNKVKALLQLAIGS